LEASAEWKTDAKLSTWVALALLAINTTAPAASKLQVDIAQPPERGGVRR
jgi:hypothetical protein